MFHDQCTISRDKQKLQAVITSLSLSLSLSLSGEVYITVLPARISHSAPDHVDDRMSYLAPAGSLPPQPLPPECPQGGPEQGGQLASPTSGLLLQICRQEGQLHRQPD